MGKMVTAILAVTALALFLPRWQVEASEGVQRSQSAYRAIIAFREKARTTKDRSADAYWEKMDMAVRNLQSSDPGCGYLKTMARDAMNVLPETNGKTQYFTFYDACNQVLHSELSADFKDYVRPRMSLKMAKDMCGHPTCN